MLEHREPFKILICAWQIFKELRRDGLELIEKLFFQIYNRVRGNWVSQGIFETFD